MQCFARQSNTLAVVRVPLDCAAEVVHVDGHLIEVKGEV
jgi:hypothetical protein